MPEPETVDEPRRRPLLTVLFWAGVGLAPVAALLLLVGEGNGPLRIAAVLAVLAVVLIGLSITMRGDATAVRVEMEELLLEELDGLRAGLRDDITTAARATHHAFGEKFQVLQNDVEALRGRVDAMAAARTDPGRAEAARGDAGRGPVRGPDRAEFDGGGYDQPRYGQGDHARAEAAGGGPRDQGRTAGPPDGPARYGTPAPPAGPGQYGPAQYGAAPSAGSAQYGVPGAASPSGPGQYGMPRSARAGGPSNAEAPPRPPHLPGGVVRHTETVQVTTRSTIVGPTGADAGAGNAYGGGAYSGNTYSGNVYGGGGGGGGDQGTDGYGDQGGGGYAPAAGGNRYAEPNGGRGYREDQRPEPDGGRGYGGQASAPEDGRQGEPEHGRRSAAPEEPRSSRRESEPRAGGGRRSRRGESDEDLAHEAEYWSGLRAGDRWASMRSDERGHEVRMGERRAAVHVDESGTELRVEDRWAAVRHEDPRGGESWRTPGRRRDTRWAEEESRDDTGGRGAYGAPGEWSPDGTRRGGRGDDGEPEPRGDRGRDRRAQPALPAGGVEPPQEWRQARDEPAGRRRRRADVDEEYGYPPADDIPRAGGARRAEYEYTEDRWR